MKIYIAGSGALGCRIGAYLKAADQDVTLLDYWEDHIKAIQDNGLKITGDKEWIIDIPVMKPEEATEAADLIIVLTKAMQLPDMMEAVKSLMTTDTKILCLLNGIGHEDVISQYVPLENIIMGVTLWSAGLKGPGHAHLIGSGTINLQSMTREGEVFGRQVADVLNLAGLNAEYDTDILPSIWRKACVNGTFNAYCALLDCTVGEFFATDNGRAIAETVVHEFVDVANLEGIMIEFDAMWDYVQKAAVTVKDHYPSMHQDLVQNHRLTEVDYINGAVVRKGRAHNFATPYCQQIVDLVHAKEKIMGIQ